MCVCVRVCVLLFVCLQIKKKRKLMIEIEWINITGEYSIIPNIIITPKNVYISNNNHTLFYENYTINIIISQLMYPIATITTPTKST